MTSHNGSSSPSHSEPAFSSYEQQPSRLKRGFKRERSQPEEDSHPRPPKTVKQKQEDELANLLADDDAPLINHAPAPRRDSAIKREQSLVSGGSDGPQNGRVPDNSNDQGYRWWDGGKGEEDNKIKWTTLSHHAVMFPPEYEPHNVPLLYNGELIKLSPRAEEVATYYAAKLGTDYIKSDTFNRNFFEDFQGCLEKGMIESKKIRDLKLCDFSKIYEHLEKKKAEKKDLPAAEKKKIKEAEVERCKKYTVALVDGREEKVGNYRVEPPGLFLGRGDHPKRGKLKARIYPEDITINIGVNDPIPECPMPGHKWGSIVHKQDVTWLCGWKDTITGGSKYVWLAAGSAFKGMSDHAKFEKARKLKHHIEKIRHDYREGFKSKSKEVRQRSVAMYLIDKLALRVGNEKGEEEADTVGCCSLRVEHLEFEPPCTVVFDFLGKDSIRYFNSVEVEKPVFDSLKLFCRNKEPQEEVFHRLTVTGLNDHLKSLMDGLSAKVFRTFNASITLDQLLQDTPTEVDDNGKIVFYNQQNKEVAILCNHQRALPKQHESQMEKIGTRVSELEEWLSELQRGSKALAKSRDTSKTIDLVQWIHEKPNFTEDMDEKTRTAERKRAAEAPRKKAIRTKRKPQIEATISQVERRLAKLKADMQTKDDLKMVALGTSKINYLDPRITVAWCKKHDVPIERIFAKNLLNKFAWAMEASEEYRF